MCSAVRMVMPRGEAGGAEAGWAAARRGANADATPAAAAPPRNCRRFRFDREFRFSMMVPSLDLRTAESPERWASFSAFPRFPATRAKSGRIECADRPYALHRFPSLLR